MEKLLKKTEFGNPVLRGVATKLTLAEIQSPETQELIRDMYFTLENRKYGVGLAAPQVGEGIALCVIGVKATPTRPHLERIALTLINPEIVATYGYRKPMWEGCISGSDLYALVPRYKRLRLKWHDADAKLHEEDFDGFLAHVIQHEVDHLNGILYVDRIKDTKSIMTMREYKKQFMMKRQQPVPKIT